MQLLELSNSSLYSNIAGSSWADVAEQVRGLHLGEHAPHLEARGTFAVKRGSHVLSRLLGFLMRLPAANDRSDVRLTITRQGRRERWTRMFDGRPFASTQWAASDHLLAERWCCVDFRFRLIVSEGTLRYAQCACSLGFGRASLPLPTWLSPRLSATEQPSDDGSCSRVAVSVSIPLAGMLMEYQGDIRLIGNQA